MRNITITFEPDVFFGQLFGAKVSKHNYFYEGGNFAANGAGDCIVVNRKASYPGGVSDTASIPDEIFKSKYGCNRLIRFKAFKRHRPRRRSGQIYDRIRPWSRIHKICGHSAGRGFHGGHAA